MPKGAVGDDNADPLDGDLDIPKAQAHVQTERSDPTASPPPLTARLGRGAAVVRMGRASGVVDLVGSVMDVWWLNSVSDSVIQCYPYSELGL